jgi:hypothetical protein
MVLVRAVGRKERCAVYEVAKIPVLCAILGVPGTKVRIGNRFGYFVDQVVRYCIHSYVAIGTSRIAIVGHIARTSTVYGRWQVRRNGVLDICAADDTG